MGAAATSCRTSIPFDDLDLGPLLGKGSFGRVYRGHWEGNPVAVKVRRSQTCGRVCGQGQGQSIQCAMMQV